MTSRTVRAYEQELESLTQCLTRMGALAETQVGDLLGIFAKRDLGAADALIAKDRDIDAYHQQIKQLGYELLARRNPVANDLRTVIVSQSIARDIERVGDMAKNSATRAKVIFADEVVVPLQGLQGMGNRTKERFNAVIDALIHRSTDKAVAVWGGDDSIDEMYNSLYYEIIEWMTSDSANVNSGAHMLFIAKNLERIGDHATNVAEDVYFALSGEYLDEARPKGDITSSTAVLQTYLKSESLEGVSESERGN